MQDDEYTNYYASLMQQMQQAGSSPASSEDSGERNGSSGGSPASSDDLEKQYHHHHHHHTGLSPAESNGDYLYEAMGTHNVSYDADDDSEEEEEMVELPHHRLMISSPTAAAAVATTAKKRKKRAKRDPNKPKGFLPAILLYSNANRPRVKEENPTATFGEVVSNIKLFYATSFILLCILYATIIFSPRSLHITGTSTFSRVQCTVPRRCCILATKSCG